MSQQKHEPRLIVMLDLITFGPGTAGHVALTSLAFKATINSFLLQSDPFNPSHFDEVNRMYINENHVATRL